MGTSSAAYRDAGGAVGPADDALWTRAHGWGLMFALMLLANSADHPQLLAVGRRTLRAVLA